MTETIGTIFGNYECRSYFNDDNDNGLEITNTSNGNRVGSMVGYNLPNVDDNDELDSFIELLEDWLIDNE